MGVGVLDHPVLPDESLAAHFAAERFLSGVEAHVPPQVGLVVELLRANLALVRLVTGMLGQVLLQIKKKKSCDELVLCFTGIMHMRFRRAFVL